MSEEYITYIGYDLPEQKIFVQNLRDNTIYILPSKYIPEFNSGKTISSIMEKLI